MIENWFMLQNQGITPKLRSRILDLADEINEEIKLIEPKWKRKDISNETILRAVAKAKRKRIILELESIIQAPTKVILSAIMRCFWKGYLKIVRVDGVYSEASLTELGEKYLQFCNIPEAIKNYGNKEFSKEEVQRLIQAIYSEFAELPIGQHTTYFLKDIIKTEVEEHPVKPIKIFQ